MAQRKEIEDYLKTSKSLVLGTVDKDGNPQIRHLGGYGVDGIQVYISTSKESDKVKQIAQNPNVAAIFHHEGQTPPNLKNITLYGKAKLLTGDEFIKAIDIIKARRPQANVNPETNNIYRIETEEVKILDFAQGPVQVLQAKDIQ